MSIHWTTKLLLDRAEFDGAGSNYGFDWLLSDDHLKGVKGGLEIRLTMVPDGSKFSAVCLDLGEKLGEELSLPIGITLVDLLFALERLADGVEIPLDEGLLS